MVPGAVDTIKVTAFDAPRLIEFDWSDGSHVRLFFSLHAPSVTKIRLEASRFDAATAIDTLVDATEGYTVVLCDLKCLLETGRSPGLVRDKAALIAASMAQPA
jgi:hypothetical protein